MVVRPQYVPIIVEHERSERHDAVGIVSPPSHPSATLHPSVDHDVHRLLHRSAAHRIPIRPESVVVAYPLGVVDKVGQQLAQLVCRVSLIQIYSLYESRVGSASDQRVHQRSARLFGVFARHRSIDRLSHPTFQMPQVQDTTSVREVFINYGAYPPRSVPCHRLSESVLNTLSASLGVYQSSGHDAPLRGASSANLALARLDPTSLSLLSPG